MNVAKCKMVVTNEYPNHPIFGNTSFTTAVEMQIAATKEYYHPKVGIKGSLTLNDGTKVDFVIDAAYITDIKYCNIGYCSFETIGKYFSIEVVYTDTELEKVDDVIIDVFDVETMYDDDPETETHTLGDGDIVIEEHI